MQSIIQFTHASIDSSTCTSMHSSNYLTLYLLTHLPTYLPIYLHTYLSIFMPAFLPVCLSSHTCLEPTDDETVSTTISSTQPKQVVDLRHSITITKTNYLALTQSLTLISNEIHVLTTGILSMLFADIDLHSRRQRQRAFVRYVKLHRRKLPRNSRYRKHKIIAYISYYFW